MTTEKRNIMKRNIKQIAVWAMALLIMGAFLVLCSEPAPGNDPGVWEFAWPKLLGLCIIGGCVWAINKLEVMEG